MNEMINRRSFLGFLPAALGLAAVPALAKRPVPIMATGEFIVLERYWSSCGILISPEDLADIRSWECSENDMKKFMFDEWDGQINYVYGDKTPQV